MASNKLTMQKTQLYIQAFVETSLLGWITLADLDLYVRVTTGLIGVILACFTGYKIWQSIKTNTIRQEITRLDLRLKNEEVRRYFEQKYKNETDRNSKELPESVGTGGEQVQG